MQEVDNSARQGCVTWGMDSIFNLVAPPCSPKTNLSFLFFLYLCFCSHVCQWSKTEWYFNPSFEEFGDWDLFFALSCVSTNLEMAAKAKAKSKCIVIASSTFCHTKHVSEMPPASRRSQDHVTYHQDDVGALRSFQCPFAVWELGIVTAISRAFNLRQIS